ncbi:MAG: prephenate dehydrogenase/arogenate dehydrogenase family protein [Candidatus Helarchaeota archaeon]
MHVCVVGGTGGMGKLLAKAFLDIEDYSIQIISRDIKKAERVAREIGTNVSYGILNDCKNADIVIVSVPIDHVLRTCQDVVKIMKDGALLMDLSSVKGGLVDKLKVPSHVEYISCHPLFGPLGDIREENIILIPVKGKNWFPKIQALFQKIGSQISVTTAEEHDEIMSKIQVMYHFSNLCLITALAKSRVSSEHYTRSFKKIRKFLKGFQQNFDVIFEIQQHNPKAIRARKFFAEVVQDLASKEISELEKIVRESYSQIE